jgi:hypothetical protein
MSEESEKSYVVLSATSKNPHIDEEFLEKTYKQFNPECKSCGVPLSHKNSLNLKECVMCALGGMK